MILVCCEDKNSTDSNKQKTLELQSFHTVKITGIFNLVLIQDSVNKLIINGNARKVQDATAYTIEDTLYIEANKKMLFGSYEKTNLELHFTTITVLWTYDPVKVSNIDTLNLNWFYYFAIGEIGEAELKINCDFFSFHNSQNTLGHFYFSGNSRVLHIFNRYGCSVFADHFIAETAYVTNQSIGDVFINVSSELEAYIWGTGNIYYDGNPHVETIEDWHNGGMLIPMN